MGKSDMSNDFIAIIPARYASTRFPGKPLADIGGKTMIQRVYEQASKAVGRVMVATDDERIRAEVARFGGEAVMTSALHRSGTDRAAEAFRERCGATGNTVVINVQGDEPFVQPAQIRRLMDCFADGGVQIATLVKPVASHEELFNPNHVKVVRDLTGRALYFSRWPVPYQRNVPEEVWHERHTYFKHLGIYAYRADILAQLTALPPSALETAESLEQNRWLENGYVIHTAETDSEGLSIDTPEDLEAVRARLPYL